MSRCSKLEAALPFVLAGLMIAGDALAGGVSVSTEPKKLFCDIYSAMEVISPILALIFFSFAGWRYFVQGARLDMLVAPIGGGVLCAAAPWFVQTLFGSAGSC